MTSPTVGRNPCWRHALRQSSRKLITGRLLYNLVVSTPYSEARVFSPVREAWVEQIWRMDCYPCSKSPLSTSLKWSSRKAISNTAGFSNVAVVARTWLYTASGCLSELQLRIYPRGWLVKPFPWLVMDKRQRRFEEFSFSFLSCLPRLMSPICAKQLVLTRQRNPSFAPSPVSKSRFAGLKD